MLDYEALIETLKRLFVGLSTHSFHMVYIKYISILPPSEGPKSCWFFFLEFF
jgi:hypothetical protein